MGKSIIRTLLAWAVAAAVGYALFAFTSQTVVLNGLVDIGAPMPLGTRLASSVHAILNMPELGQVIAVGFAIAFVVAKGVKSILKPLAPIAYPVAGAAAVSVALELMWQQYEVYPVLGAQKPLGYALAVLSGAVAGYVFLKMLPPPKPA